MPCQASVFPGSVFQTKNVRSAALEHSSERDKHAAAPEFAGQRQNLWHAGHGGTKNGGWYLVTPRFLLLRLYSDRCSRLRDTSSHCYSLRPRSSWLGAHRLRNRTPTGAAATSAATSARAGAEPISSI